jgi:hypothetical protein
MITVVAISSGTINARGVSMSPANVQGGAPNPLSADGHHEGQHRDDDEARAHLGLRRRDGESCPGRDQYRHGDPNYHDQQLVQRVLTEGTMSIAKE